MTDSNSMKFAYRENKELEQNRFEFQLVLIITISRFTRPNHKQMQTKHAIRKLRYKNYISQLDVCIQIYNTGYSLCHQFSHVKKLQAQQFSRLNWIDR